MNNEYVTVELRVHRSVETPDGSGLQHLLESEWGLQMNAQEVFWVVAYDAARNIRKVAEVARGSYNDVVVSISSLLSAVLVAGADRFEVVHNHPSGDVEPSEMDIQLTQKIMAGANACGLTFEDHVIIGPPNQWYSMLQNGVIVLSDRIAKDREARIRRTMKVAAPMFVVCRPAR